MSEINDAAVEAQRDALAQEVAATLAAHPWSAMRGGCAPRSGCDWQGGWVDDEQDRHAAHVANLVLAVVREHLPVKPDREAAARAIFEAGAAGAAVEFGLDGPVPWSSLDADDVERMCAQADAVLDLWPGESRATVQAEALHAFADARGVNAGDNDDEWWRGYRQAQRECLHDASARADRLAAEGGADRD